MARPFSKSSRSTIVSGRIEIAAGAGRCQVGERAIHADAVGDVLRRRSDAWGLVGRAIEIGYDGSPTESAAVMKARSAGAMSRSGNPKYRHRAAGSGEWTASGSASARWKYGNLRS